MIKIYSLIKVYIIIFILLLLSIITFSQETRQLAIGKPDAIADLKTTEGAALVNAKWFVQPAHIQEAGFKAPGANATDPMKLYPTGMKINTHTLQPQINASDFDNGLVEIKPTDLEMREGMGLISAAWYKVEVALPQTIGKLSVSGSAAVFEIT